MRKVLLLPVSLPVVTGATRWCLLGRSLTRMLPPLQVWTGLKHEWGQPPWTPALSSPVQMSDTSSCSAESPPGAGSCGSEPISCSRRPPRCSASCAFEHIPVSSGSPSLSSEFSKPEPIPLSSESEASHMPCVSSCSIGGHKTREVTRDPCSKQNTGKGHLSLALSPHLVCPLTSMKISGTIQLNTTAPSPS